MGNPNYTINEQLTASAGQRFLGILDSGQAALVNGIVEEQRAALTGIVAAREAVATRLRRFMIEADVDSSAVLDLSAQYGALDGVIIHTYATRFAQVAATLTTTQRAQLAALADSLGYTPAPGGFLYSSPVAMPTIADTDFLFAASTSGIGAERIADAPALHASPNPGNPRIVIRFDLPTAQRVRLAIFDVAGRRVRRLADGDLPAGPQTFTWDGRDDAGREAATGSYLAELRAGAGAARVKLMLLR